MAKAKAPASEKREYKTPEAAANQKAQWEKKGYKVTRKGNILYHYCPAISRIETTGCHFRVNHLGNRKPQVPVKWAFSRKA